MAEKIGAEAHVIGSDQVDHVVDVVQQHLQAGLFSCRAQGSGTGADDSTSGGDGADLFVAQIALGIPQRTGISMGGADGPAGDFQRLPEAVFNHVGEVDQHAEPVHLAQYFRTHGSEAAGRIVAPVV